MHAKFQDSSFNCSRDMKKDPKCENGMTGITKGHQKCNYLFKQETQLKLAVADRTKPEVEIWRRPKKSTF